MVRTDFLDLRYGAGRVVEPFLARLFGERVLKTVFWVSPWVTHLEFGTGTTEKLLRKFSLSRVNFIVITRKPDLGSPHEKFIQDVRELPHASVFYMPLLHAKFYLAKTSERRYALLGSANMYRWSSRSYELGVVVEARGEGEVLVDKLEDLAIELRVTRQTTRA